MPGPGPPSPPEPPAYDFRPETTVAFSCAQCVEERDEKRLTPLLYMPRAELLLVCEAHDKVVAQFALTREGLLWAVNYKLARADAERKPDIRLAPATALSELDKVKPS